MTARLLFGTWLCLGLLFPFPCVTAQNEVYERFPLPDNRSDIQSPADYLGYRLGERFTEYARSTAYFRYLAEQSPRIRLEEYGETYEGRPLVLLVMSAEENMDRLEDIRRAQLALVEGAGSQGQGEGGIPDGHPVINSFSYNIHGNEASSTEAAMQVAYELATTRDPAVLEALEKSVMSASLSSNARPL